nr:hypothetical protein [Methylomarinum sp. Ch1-1]MDP4523201.1 hypothetical protein [Methylomarinum sp. Ch1-1]
MNHAMYESEPLTHWMLDDFNNFLIWAAELNCSDINLVPNDPVWIKVYGDWHAVTRRPVGAGEIRDLLDAITGSPSSSARTAGAEALDFRHEIKLDRSRKIRFRVNATSCRDGFSSGINMVMRSIPDTPPDLEELNLEPGILSSCFPSNGLVLVAGVMGSGKSTLISSILGEIIKKHKKMSRPMRPLLNLT